MTYRSPAALPPSVLERSDVRDALSRHDFGKVFALARKWGGISFLKIADACDISPERVGKLAKGTGTITSYRKIAVIADALRIPGSLIGLAPRPWEGGRLDSAPSSCSNDAGEAEDEAVRRRKFIAASVVAAGIPATFPFSAGGRIGATTVERLRERTARLRRLDDFLGGADTYPIYLGEFEATTSLLKKSSYNEVVGRALLSLSAEQAQQAGWAAFDAGRHPEAERLYRTAHHMAIQAEDQALMCNSLAFLAYQQVSTERSGVELASASCERMGREVPATVRALLLERRAWAHARAGETKETERALAEGEAELIRSSETGAAPHWASWVDMREHQIMTGRCWTELGRPLRAVPALESALRTFSDTHARDKSLYLTWLAHAYFDAGEIEQAAVITGRSLQLANGVGSVRPRERVQTLVHRLEPHRALPEVATVLEEAVA
ncbi:XRE family transcriptional regulator [Streptomyces sp. 3MP-14]|uniref:XRE family transcriptional regulator n=1 Tax=Streptomyces mimosae TaxID=2586635 RepID=A0A5N6ATI1_9ACTN|nr:MULTISPECIES: XRE family transcriptional regulator [Streptomyces]KAB8171018.1 XRE family transcriptional regulator [Streptomyces mimosae]KAB8179631.1 XRE family transcriptional regulator [Streptomyces sp. 3MP-14]